MKPSGREIVEQYMQAIPRDWDTVRVLQHPDFVGEYPQSGEVIRGRDNFRAANERYSQVQTDTRRVTGTEDRWILSPGFWSLTPTKIVGAGDTFTVEALATYPGGDNPHPERRLSVLPLQPQGKGKPRRNRSRLARSQNPSGPCRMSRTTCLGPHQGCSGPRRSRRTRWHWKNLQRESSHLIGWQARMRSRRYPSR